MDELHRVQVRIDKGEIDVSKTVKVVVSVSGRLPSLSTFKFEFMMGEMFSRSWAIFFPANCHDKQSDNTNYVTVTYEIHSVNTVITVTPMTLY